MVSKGKGDRLRLRLRLWLWLWLWRIAGEWTAAPLLLILSLLHSRPCPGHPHSPALPQNH